MSDHHSYRRFSINIHAGNRGDEEGQINKQRERETERETETEAERQREIERTDTCTDIIKEKAR